MPSDNTNPASRVTRFRTTPATLPQIGIPRQRAAEFKAMAEAGEA